MPINMRTVKFDFSDPSQENVFASVEFRMPKEMVDNLEITLKEKGIDAFFAAIPTSFVFDGEFNWMNQNMIHLTPEVHQIMTREELQEDIRKEIPGYELSK